MNQMLSKASEAGYAVCAFNVDHMEMIRALVEAAEAEQAPVIIQIEFNHGREMGLEVFTTVGKLFAERSNLPVALHLDHGTTLDGCKACLDAGFTSVMFDASDRSLLENVKMTQAVVELAQAYDTSVEGAVGYIPSVMDNPDECLLSDPQEVQEYCEMTGVDCVSVAIGNVHYMQDELLHLDFERLQEIRRRVTVPLVLHGGAAVTDQDMKKSVALGISKYNIMYKIHKAFLLGTKESLDHLNDEVTPGKYLVASYPTLRYGLDAAVADCRSKIRILGSSGKA
jgi:fructose-bisphosphate aldolase class II